MKNELVAEIKKTIDKKDVLAFSLLIEKFDINSDFSVDKVKNKYEHIANYCLRKDAVEFLRIISLVPGVDFGIANNNKMAPIHTAIHNKCEDGLNILLSHPTCDVNQLASQDMHPFVLAVRIKNFNMAKAISDHKNLNFSSCQDMAFFIAANNKSPKFMDLIMDDPRFNPNGCSEYATNPFDEVLRLASLKYFKKLINMPTFEWQKRNGAPMWWKVAHGHQVNKMITVFSHPKLDINETDDNNKTILFNLSLQYCELAAPLLIRHKINVCHETNEGDNVVTYMGIRNSLNDRVKNYLDILMPNMDEKSLKKTYEKFAPFILESEFAKYICDYTQYAYLSQTIPESTSKVKRVKI